MAVAFGAGLLVAGLGMRRRAAALDGGERPTRSVGDREEPTAGGRGRGVAKTKGIAGGLARFAGLFVLIGLVLGLYRRIVSAVAGAFEDPALAVGVYRRAVSAAIGWFEEPAVVVGLLAGLVVLAATILGFEIVTWNRERRERPDRGEAGR